MITTHLSRRNRGGLLGLRRQHVPLLLMLLPGFLILIAFNYLPLLGNVIAFQKFIPTKGFLHSKWVGLDNFRALFNYPNFGQILYNTVSIAVMKIVMGLVVPVIFALLLNEMRSTWGRRTLQTLVYMPHFLSWVILGGILVDVLSTNGIVNLAIKALGYEPIFFLGSPEWFPFTLIITDTWKEFGFSAIVYLAALTGVDPALYEAAIIDGAGRLKQTWHVTLPGISSTIVLMATLALGNVLNAGFDQVYNLYSPAVYSTGDIIDTMVYRTGLLDARYGLSTAAGMFKSCISLVLILTSYKLADRFAGYRIF